MRLIEIKTNKVCISVKFIVSDGIGGEKSCIPRGRKTGFKWCRVSVISSETYAFLRL